jgi:hypothetical protein
VTGCESAVNANVTGTNDASAGAVKSNDVWNATGIENENAVVAIWSERD